MSLVGAGHPKPEAISVDVGPSDLPKVMAGIKAQGLYSLSAGRKVPLDLSESSS